MGDWNCRIRRSGTAPPFSILDQGVVLINVIACPGCNTTNRANSLLCTNCGCALPNSLLTTTDSPQFGGARITATVLKTFAMIWILAGIVALIRTNSVLHGLNAPSTTLLYSALAEIAITVLGAASIGFFSYVLELLISIERNTKSFSK